MLEYNVILTHIIYAYMVTFTLFVCLFNPKYKKTEIYIPYTARQPKKTPEIWIFAHITQPQVYIYYLEVTGDLQLFGFPHSSE